MKQWTGLTTLCTMTWASMTKPWASVKLFGIGLVAILVIALAGCENPQIAGPVGVDTSPIALSEAEMPAASPSDDGDGGLALSRVLHLATTDCSFTTAGTTTYLNNNCTTDGRLLFANTNIEGQNYTITPVDPLGGSFAGGVIENGGGDWLNVRNVNIVGALSVNASHAGDDRLRGVYLNGVHATVENVTVLNLNQGASGAQEGNAIEVRNFTATGTKTVVVKNNTVDGYQKTGVLVIGDVDATIESNSIGSSATQLNLAANALQIGNGGQYLVQHNTIMGNQWLGESNFAATAILNWGSNSSNIRQNKIDGNADVALYVISDNGTYEHNDIRDFGTDGPHGDFGIVNFGSNNTYNYNRICGYMFPFYPENLAGKNVTLPEKACSR